MFDNISVRVRWKSCRTLLHLLRSRQNKNISYRKHKICVRSRFGTVAHITVEAGSGTVVVDGSAPKFLTGQNVLGVEQLTALCVQFVVSVLSRAGAELTDEELRWIREGHVTLLRVDFAAHVDCGSERLAIEFMQALQNRWASVPRDFYEYRSESICFTPHSERWSLKANLKGAEIRAHPLSRLVFNRGQIIDYAIRLVRFEIVFRSKELKRLGLDSPGAWNSSRARALLITAVTDVVPVEVNIPNPAVMSKLSKPLQLRLEVWLRGGQPFNKDSSSYRQDVRQIRDVTGIDVRCHLRAAGQSKCFITMKQIFKRGFGFKCCEDKWSRLLDAAP